MNDTFYWFDNWTQKQVLEKIKEVGNFYLDDPLEESHNDSPSIREFFEMEEKFKDNEVIYSGYVVLKPRSDYRVTVDAITFKNLTPSEREYLREHYDNSDEATYNKEDKTLRFWWD
jgi:hypothetical protein